MPLSLAEAAKASTDSLQRGVLETFVQESNVLDRLPMLSIEGNAYAYNQEESLPGVAFRAVNASYPESTGTINQATESLSILGGDADVDRFIVQTRGNLMDQRALQTRLKVKAASLFYADAFINGGTDTASSLTAEGHVAEGNAKALSKAKRAAEEGDFAPATAGFDGLKARLTDNQTIDGTGIGLDGVMDNAKAFDFFDLLDEALGAVPGVTGSNGVIYANSSLIRKIISATRRINGGSVEWLSDDMTGKRTIQWNGVPVVDLGVNGAGDDIIPGSDLYVVKFGRDESDGGVTGLTNGGVQVRDLGELDSKPVFRTRLEFYTGLAVFGGKAAARVTNLGTEAPDEPEPEA